MSMFAIFTKTSRFSIAIACCLFASSCFCETSWSQVNESASGRDGNRWVVPVTDNGPTVVPRIYASLRKAHFEGFPEAIVTVQPEIETWELRFSGEAKSKRIVLEFDSAPMLKNEIKPIDQAGDSTLTLVCSQGTTKGGKLRFEPQQHKNTIGYWTVATDTVSWEIKIGTAGTFNVGILQGCGPKGGGTAKVSLVKDDLLVDSFEFTVEPTGHFQNFVWRNVGLLSAKEQGNYVVRIEAVKINEVALMDVRQLHLSPKR